MGLNILNIHGQSYKLDCKYLYSDFIGQANRLGQGSL